MGRGPAGVQVSRTLAQGHGTPVLHGRQSGSAVHRTVQHHHILLRQRVTRAQTPRQNQDRQQQRQRQVRPHQ